MPQRDAGNNGRRGASSNNIFRADLATRGDDFYNLLDGKFNFFTFTPKY